MPEHEKIRSLEQKTIQSYLLYLQEQEFAAQTIQKYTHVLQTVSLFLPEKQVTKHTLLVWKEYLMAHYAAASVNTMVAALNGFLQFMGWYDLKLKPLKIQRQIFCNTEKELSRAEYLKLVQTANVIGKQRISLILQTICATGIRVSELQYITVEAVQTGSAQVTCKGKRRIVFLPKTLRKVLIKYIRQQKRTMGSVFVTKQGKELHRSHIWRDMKALCQSAGVAPEKVFPHNLRHLFARTYYAMEKDLSRLADILGHSNINTTRIYTIESGGVHIKQLDHMKLVMTEDSFCCSFFSNT